MSNQETDDLFNALDEMLSNAADGKEMELEEDDFDVFPLESHATDDENEENLEETIRSDVQPLLSEIITLCNEANFPSQFAFRASSKQIMTTMTYPDNAMQIQAAVCVYLMPHNFSHLIAMLSKVPFHLQAYEKSIEKNENLCEKLQEQIKNLTRKCDELKVAVQWAVIVHRTEETLELWRGYHHTEESYNCVMKAADGLYCVGNTLSFEVVTLFKDLFPKEDDTV